MTDQRRLAAILVADIVGYSKLIGGDETGTLAQLQILRTQIIEPQLAKHAGRPFGPDRLCFSLAHIDPAPALQVSDGRAWRQAATRRRLRQQYRQEHRRTRQRELHGNESGVAHACAPSFGRT